MKKLKFVASGTAIALFEEFGYHRDVKEMLEGWLPLEAEIKQAGFSECLTSGTDAGLLYFFGKSTSTELDSNSMEETYLQETNWYYLLIRGGISLVINQPMKDFLDSERCTRPCYSLKLEENDNTYQFDIVVEPSNGLYPYRQLFSDILKTGRIPQFSK
jgi:hypothetical protein